MPTKTYLLIIFLMPVLLWGQENSYILTGKMGNWNMPVNIYLAYKKDGKNTVDSTSISLVKTGTIAPEFVQADTKGKPVKLSSFRGKYVLIDFWASWCGPCRADNPELVRIHKKYSQKNFTILGVSLDKSDAKKAWVDAIKKDGLTWQQVSDLKGWDNEVGKLYGVRAIPQNFLVDPEGKIIAIQLKSQELDQLLEKIL